MVIIFSYFKFARFNFACFNFDAFVLQVSRLTWRRRDNMTSFVQSLGGVDLMQGVFLYVGIFL